MQFKDLQLITWGLQIFKLDKSALEIRDFDSGNWKSADPITLRPREARQGVSLQNASSRRRYENCQKF